MDNLDSEIEQMSRIIERESITKLIVDSYSVTYKYLKSLSEITSVVYIDDLNAFDYPIDTIICCANYYRKFEFEKRFPEKTLLLGCEYVPLRKEFRNLEPKEIKEEIENLLILSGGSDNYHVVKNILNSIDVKRYKRINAICGRYNMDYDELVEKYSSSDVVKVHRDVNNIVDYMKDADLAISAGGSTLYELCACGTPTISYAIADNQLDNVREFDKNNVCIYLGDIRLCVPFLDLKDMISMYDYTSRKNKSKRACELVDGMGAKRIVQEIMSKGD